MSTPHAAGHTTVTCSKCGKEASVPFTPTPGRPVFCRECFSGKAAPGGPPRAHYSQPRHSAGGPRGPAATNQRQRMMAQGRKGHFMHDAKAVLTRMEGGMDDNHIRAFLEGLFARGARTNTAAAQDFLDEKLADQTITADQRRALGDLVERYSFWR